MGREQKGALFPPPSPGPRASSAAVKHFISDGDEEMKSLLGKLENDTQSDETEREEDVFSWLNGQGVFDCRYPEYIWDWS